MALGLGLLAAGRDGFDRWIKATALPGLVLAQSTEVLARDGRLLRAYTVEDGRWRLAPGPVDPLFLAMLIGYEDRRFYQHGGVDDRAVLRAGLQGLAAGRVVSGASTLTMQVARLLENSGTGALAGKLRQARLALALERRLSKDAILDLYLALAPYGGNLEGIRAASLAWFGREPRRLTAAQAALLVALPQSPETRRPDRFPKAAALARARVLDRALAQGLIDASSHRAALAEPLPRARAGFPALAPHLADRLRAALPGQARIETSLDADLQARLEALAQRVLAGLGPRLGLAMVLADHRDGRILASVGAADWRDTARLGAIDMTQALRSPGSTLKPFVYALAFDQGLAHPETLIEDRPLAFGRYRPQNFDRRFHGTLPLREALQLSLNIPVVSLTETLGPERLLTLLERAGARPALAGRPGLAVALGGLGISLQDLVQSYAMLARLGRPVALSPLAADAAAAGTAGGTAAGAPPPPQLLRPEAAWLVGDVLAGIAPPPLAARPADPRRRLAWKTGTSYGHRDALAVGYDGAHVLGVWIGRPDGTPVPGAFGADLAAPVLFEAFALISPEPAARPAPPPGTLIVAQARLPQPLQVFRPRGLAAASAAVAGGRGAAGAPLAAGGAPEIAFPPEGAEIAPRGGQMVAKVRGGTPPFTWLADGQPLVLASPARETALQLAPALARPGQALRLTVLDSAGRAASVAFRLR